MYSSSISTYADNDEALALVLALSPLLHGDGAPISSTSESQAAPSLSHVSSGSRIFLFGAAISIVNILITANRIHWQFSHDFYTEFLLVPSISLYLDVSTTTHTTYNLSVPVDISPYNCHSVLTPRTTESMISPCV